MCLSKTSFANSIILVVTVFVLFTNSSLNNAPDNEGQMLISSSAMFSGRVIYLNFMQCASRLVVLKHRDILSLTDIPKKHHQPPKMDRNQTPNAADVDRHAAQNQEEDKNCSICHESLTNPVTTSTCGHEFCSDCIKPWLEVNNKCPNCRAIFPEGTAPQPAPYFEYENNGPEMENNWRPRRDSVTELRNQLARHAVSDITVDLYFLDEAMIDLFEELFPSPNARLLIRSIIRIRDAITFEIDIFSTTHDMGPRLDNLTVAEVHTLHETVLHIRRQINDLGMAIERLLRNVNARGNTSELHRQERLTHRWNLLCREMVRTARSRTNALNRATPA